MHKRRMQGQQMSMINRQRAMHQANAERMRKANEELKKVDAAPVAQAQENRVQFTIGKEAPVSAPTSVPSATSVPVALGVYVIKESASVDARYFKEYFGVEPTIIEKTSTSDAELVKAWSIYSDAPLTDVEREYGGKLLDTMLDMQKLFTMRGIVKDAIAKDYDKIAIVRGECVVRRSAKFSCALPYKLLYLGSTLYRVPVEAGGEWIPVPMDVIGDFAIAIDCEVFELMLEQLNKMHMPFEFGTLELVRRLYPSECFVAIPSNIMLGQLCMADERKEYLPIDISDLERSIVQDMMGEEVEEDVED